MLQQEAVAHIRTAQEKVLVKIVVGNLKTKDHAETFQSFQQDQLYAGNIITFLGSGWIIQTIKFLDIPIAFVVPLE